ncbi:MAG: biotin--[acetyl-CoA-carboxylase] ligase [Verrucomicrobiia bacterium]|jgi:BirA family biotin operon repressor/biotin-[acetyl-CoA-carboxylase] ligase
MKAGTAILEAFYQAAGQFVRADDLGRRLKLSAATVSTEVAELERLGYTIESHPHLGYRLLGTPDRLTADDIKARLRSKVIGAEVLLFEETASTNDVVEQLAKSGACEGLVVFAESQTRGRGRRGRTWVSPRGKGLWFSVLLRPKLPPTAASRITVAASVAVARAIRESCGVDARIKWPNDVVVNDRKLAGILTELRAEADEILLAILGIGIDVNCSREDFQGDLSRVATSLELETGRSHDRVALAARVLAALDECYRMALTNFEAVADEWAKLCTTLGRQIVVTMGQRRIEGFAQALDGDGALLLRRDSGQVERILGGDVVVERA